MTAPETIQQAWLLHSRPFRETSLLLDFLTREHGRVSAIARGARSKPGRSRPVLQSFAPLNISLVGKHELKTLRSCEFMSPASRLAGNRLFAGFYLNELLVKLLPAHEAEFELFDCYAATISGLAGGQAVEPLLRSFELQLLDSLGYGLQLECDVDSGDAVEPGGEYYLRADSGFVRQIGAGGDAAHSGYPGAELLKIAAGDFSAQSTRRLAKRMLREVLQYHLGGRELSSRQLFSQRPGQADHD